MRPQLVRYASYILASTLLLAGCASRPVADTASTPAAAVNSEYRIGPGDNLNVIVWRNPEVSLAVPVRPDGKFSTPLANDIEASGKTPKEVGAEIAKALAAYITDPVVTVVVTEFSGVYGDQIRVIGQAAKPQALPYRKDMSLLDVIIAVGGTTEFAAGNRANVIRLVDGKQTKIAVRLDDLMKDGDISANLAMRPGDILVIPESIF
ncbi:XrtA/PEP-CTERM system exopolysaccharide export protein [Herbaspirillum camelliae]|uniref:XrtA/PEP-CTERM system exopolysaccharide export protein n=1 Tax=Herbaspirillum camelliae TaxID=1892903 RepID=UPI000949C638|nr:XrtA/PEP-CTERM system exopolysaccharide export protein [Herbaspirillum camelliae]